MKTYDPTSATARQTQTSVRSEQSVLNLGCGEDYREHAHNVDISPDIEADEYFDIQETPWPWDDDEFDVVIAKHVLEHLQPVPWSELQRVMAPDGRLELEYPIGHTRFEDPTHKQFWNVYTASNLVGERKHSHEAPLNDCSLIDRHIEWNVHTPGWRTWTRLRLAMSGIGPWLSQVPGLYGHVHATYRYNGGDQS